MSCFGCITVTYCYISTIPHPVLCILWSRWDLAELSVSSLPSALAYACEPSRPVALCMVAIRFNWASHGVAHGRAWLGRPGLVRATTGRWDPKDTHLFVAQQLPTCVLSCLPAFMNSVSLLDGAVCTIREKHTWRTSVELEVTVSVKIQPWPTPTGCPLPSTNP